jgi:DNA invertase Pin-like site-specific DNA recombinase
MRAVIYAAKSTEDKHGSIGTQLEDCRALVERTTGWEVAGVFTDEAFSAFKGNRGPGLAQAKALAIDLAESGQNFGHSSVVLVAQDADRFARGAGDKPGAADHLGELYFAMRRRGVALWSVRSGELDLLRATLEGERATDESQRKSQSVRAGLKRRKHSGAPVGPIPFGFCVEDPDAKTSRRIVDEDVQATADAIIERIAAGATPGDVARWLNGLGVRTRRGGTWAARSVRLWVRLEALVGEDGYPALIDRDLWERANAQLRRLDPVAVAGRMGGRPPGSDDFILRHVARCARCGRALWTVSHESGRRAYVCANVREARGICDAERIPAPEVERVVIEHLNQFVGSLESWLADVARADDDDQARRAEQITHERATLDDLRAGRARHFASYSKLVDAGDDLAHLALEPVRALDEQIREAERTIADAEMETRVSTLPDPAEAAAVYAELQALAAGRIAQARGAQAVNQALRDVLSGMWLEWDPVAGRVLGEFKLRSVRPPRLLRPPGPLADEFPVRHTSQLTFHYGSQPCQDPIALLEEQAAERVPEVVPIGYGRMSASPFAVFGCGLCDGGAPGWHAARRRFGFSSAATTSRAKRRARRRFDRIAERLGAGRR